MSVEGYYEGEREFRHLLTWDAEFLGCFFLCMYLIYFEPILWVFCKHYFILFTLETVVYLSGPGVYVKIVPD